MTLELKGTSASRALESLDNLSNNLTNGQIDKALSLCDSLLPATERTSDALRHGADVSDGFSRETGETLRSLISAGDPESLNQALSMIQNLRQKLAGGEPGTADWIFKYPIADQQTRASVAEVALGSGKEEDPK